jgi:hypothetical protein
LAVSFAATCPFCSVCGEGRFVAVLVNRSRGALMLARGAGFPSLMAFYVSFVNAIP